MHFANMQVSPALLLIIGDAMEQCGREIAESLSGISEEYAVTPTMKRAATVLDYINKFLATLNNIDMETVNTEGLAELDAKVAALFPMDKE